MDSPHVYDKAKYHFETISQHGLSEEHAANHTIFFLRWLIEQRMMSEFFEEQGAYILKKFKNGGATIHEVYEWWDCCLVDDQLSEEGNAFAMHYFDFQHGLYLRDYIATLKGDLPTEFHIDFTEENYETMKHVIDRRYRDWKKPRRKWWPF